MLPILVFCILSLLLVNAFVEPGSRTDANQGLAVQPSGQTPQQAVGTLVDEWVGYLNMALVALLRAR